MKRLPAKKFADPPTVLYTQFLLAKRGFDPKGADGTWGANSRAAMARFARRHGRNFSNLTPSSLRQLQTLN